jgi:hypothetical protein
VIRTSCLCIALALASGCGSPGGQGTTDAGGQASFTILGAATDGRVGLGYLAQLTLHGTTPADVAWSVSGAAPPGLAVTGSPGAAQLAGTPTASGDFDFTVIAQAPSGGRATLELSLSVTPRSRSAAKPRTASKGCRTPPR